MWISSLFNLIGIISSVQFLLIFSLSAVLMLFLTVCVFLNFRLGKPFVLPFSLFALGLQPQAPISSYAYDLDAP